MRAFVQEKWKKIGQVWFSIPEGIRACLVLSIACLLVFGWSLDSGPVFDDNSFLFKSNRFINAPNPWVFWIKNSGFDRSWPLSFTILWPIYQIFGDNYFVYNLINVLLHICNSLLLFLLVRKYYPKIALISALIFAIHPIQIETVCWIFQFKTILATTLFLLTLLFFHRYHKSKRITFYIFFVLLFWLSLEAKPIAILAPLFFHYFIMKGKKLKFFRTHLPALPFWILLFFSAQATIMGVVLDPYENSLKKSFSPNSIFKPLENIFHNLYRFPSDDPPSEKKEPQADEEENAPKPITPPPIAEKPKAISKKVVKKLYIPFNPSIIISRATEYKNNKQIEQAEDILKKGIQKMPREIVLYLELVYLYQEQNDQPKLLNTISQIERKFPFNTDVHRIKEEYPQIFCKQASFRSSRCYKYISDSLEKGELGHIKPYIENLSYPPVDPSQYLHTLYNYYFKTENHQRRSLITKKLLKLEPYNKNLHSDLLWYYTTYEPKKVVPFLKTILEKKIADFWVFSMCTNLNITRYKKVMNLFNRQKLNQSSKIWRKNKSIRKALLLEKNPDKMYSHILDSIKTKDIDIVFIQKFIKKALKDKNVFTLLHLFEILEEEDVYSYQIEKFKIKYFEMILGDFNAVTKIYNRLQKRHQFSQSIAIDYLLFIDKHNRYDALENIPNNFYAQRKYNIPISPKILIEKIIPPHFMIDYINDNWGAFSPFLKEKNPLQSKIIDAVIKKRPYNPELFEALITSENNSKIQEMIKQVASYHPNDRERISAFLHPKSVQKKIEKKEEVKKPEKKNEDEKSTITSQNKIIFALKNAAFYTSHFLVPYYNSLVYSRSIHSSPIMIFRILLMLFIIYLVIRKKLSLIALSFLAIFIPISGIYYVPYMKFSYVADHWIYLALAPLAIALTLLMQRIAYKRIILFIFITFLFIRSLYYQQIFNDETRVLQNAIHYAPTEYSPYMELSNKYMEQGDFIKAIQIIERAYQRPNLKENISIVERLVYLYLKNKQIVEARAVALKTAQRLLDKKEFQQAQKILRRIINHLPNDLEIRSLLNDAIGNHAE